MPAPGEEHSLCGSVSVLSCAPPRPASLSVCMYDCQYETPCGLVVCVPLPGTDESEQRGNSVVARRAGRPRSARLAPATRHLPQILRSSRSRLRLNYPGGSTCGTPELCVRADRRGGRRAARLIRAVCVHHHTPPPPPRRPCPAPPDTLVPDRRACGVGPSGGGNPPHAADVSRRAPSHASARSDRPDMYACQLVRALRGGFLWAGAGGPCRLRLAPEGRSGEHGTPQSTTSLSLASQVKVKSRPAVDVRAPPGHSWPFCVTPFLFSFPFSAKCEHVCTRKVLERYSSSYAERSTRRARISPVQLRLQCVASPCRSA